MRPAVVTSARARASSAITSTRLAARARPAVAPRLPPARITLLRSERSR